MLDNEKIISKFREEICRSFDVTADSLSDSANLFEIGLDSMFLMRMVNQFRRAGCKITLKEMYEYPTISDIKILVDRKLDAGNQLKQTSLPSHTYSVMTDGAPFPMTPVQLAYYIGREPSQPLGGNGCHLYQEFNTEHLDLALLETAINTLIQRHPMLSVSFHSDGTQRWVKPKDKQKITVHDLSHFSSEAAKHQMFSTRNKLSHRVLDVQSGQTFDIQVSVLSDQQYRVHVSIDLLVMDASSFSLFFNELSTLLRGDPLEEKSSEYDFCSYLQQESTEFSAQKCVSSEYWQSQYATLPVPPNLPLRIEPAQLQKPKFSRRRHSLHKTEWAKLQHLSATNKVTPTMVLATLYSAVLSRWSGQRKLLLNLTLFDCHPFNKHLNKMLADFTNILLLDAEISDANACDLIQDHQDRFAELYEHRMTSGVEVLRDLKKNGTHPHGAPIVFTSNLGKSLFGDDTNGPLGQPGWGISQTPQVWLDFVAFKHDEGVILQWDGIDELFPEGLVDTMFHSFTNLLSYMLANDEHWKIPLPDLLPEPQKNIRKAVNQSQGTPPHGLLHERIFEQAEKHPNRTAVISSGNILSFEELTLKAKQLAYQLVNAGLKSGEHVAVSMDKGEGQIIAVLAILYAGGVYVPIAPSQPIVRRKSIIENADIRIVIRCKTTESNFDWTDSIHLNWQDVTLETLQPAAQQRSPHDKAYIIYTSGSTGTPKGVVISHQAALNTCMDINERHDVTSADRVLALSALHFDLSVYDIFGVLTAGGALVLPQENQLRDPMAWNNLICEHQVTLWNSVPALFDMFLTFCEGMQFNAPSYLRTAMLSGDWIDLSLPARLHQYNPVATFSAMGGATEAAIWSNEYIVKKIDPSWRSIPYGYPLTNQVYRVVDEMGRDCPDRVNGELWIGGIGVALEYWNDSERTSHQFINQTCLESGETQRWYRTGDTGCYWPDGTLEFLGRKDNQVKVGGYRIELGEIDSAFNHIAGVRQGVALALSQGGSKDKQLEGFVVTEGTELHSALQPHPALPKQYRELFQEHKPYSESTEGNTEIVDFLHHHLSSQVSDNVKARTLSEWMHSYSASRKYVGLFKKWLEFLSEHGSVSKHGQGEGTTYQLLSNTAVENTAMENTAAKSRSLLGAQSNNLLAQVLRGEREAAELLESQLSPEALLFNRADFQHQLHQVITAVSALATKLKKPLNIIELESRTGLVASHISTLLGPKQVQYTALDSSLAMTNLATQRLKKAAHADVIYTGKTIPETLKGTADVLLLNNVLHRQQVPIEYLHHIKTLLAPDGLAILTEVTKLGDASLISAQVIEATTPNLLSETFLYSAFEQTGLRLEHKVLAGNHALYVLRNQNPVLKTDATKLMAKLSEQLPDYMIPKRFTFMDALPLTPNGKVDRKSLTSTTVASSESKVEPAPLTSNNEIALAKVWQSLLKTNQISKDSDFFIMGGDSLLATRCIGELQKSGLRGNLTELFTKTTLSDFAATLVPSDQGIAVNDTVLKACLSDRYLPFPMTDVQQAYWIGRQHGFALGASSSQFFIEFKVRELDVVRFNQAMDKLIERHDMLRAVVQNHQQQVLINVPSFDLKCHLFDDLNNPEADAIRNKLSHQVNNPEFWPLFSIEAILNQSQEARLFINLDNMMLDGLSMKIFLSELETIYHNPTSKLPELNVTFRDYVNWKNTHKDSDLSVIEQGKAYWHSQLATLPPAPNLPIQSDPAKLHKPKFIRAETRLMPEEWAALKEIATRHQVTPSVILMCAYASTLSAWSDNKAVTLNLTLFDRKAVHPQINHVMGDFTTLLLLAWHPENNWLTSLKRLQTQLAQDLQHRDVSAVWVMRELARQQNTANTSMPVVFTSALGTSDGDFLPDSGWLTPSWGISQTPQVWLDHQVYESSGYLCLNWDAVESLLPQPLLDKMFGHYIELLKMLARKPECWSLPLNQLISSEHNITRFTATPATPSPTLEYTKDQHVDPIKVRQIQETFDQIVCSSVGERENFFDAGANSLQLVQMHSALHQLGMSLSVTDLFTYPSPISLATALVGKAAPLDSNDTLKVRQQRQSNRKNNRRQRIK